MLLMDADIFSFVIVALATAHAHIPTFEAEIRLPQKPWRMPMLRYVLERHCGGEDARALRWRRPCRSRSRRKHTIVPYQACQMSMDFMSQEHGVPHDGPKDSNAGGCSREILDHNEIR
jgi:hypothetical protein